MRVVSLVPSVTETLSAWGVEPVAVTRFCERPDLAAVGGTKDPDVAAVVALDPDLVVLCREENRREDADALVAASVDVHVVDVDTVEDVEPQLAALAARVGVDPAAVELGVVPPAPSAPGGARRRAVVPVWRRPTVVLSRGCYGASLLSRLGVDVVPAGEGDRYPTIDLGDLVGEVDLVVAPSEPYPFSERHRAELEAVAPVVLVDGQDLFWWGVRTPAALDRLAGVLTSGGPSHEG